MRTSLWYKMIQNRQTRSTYRLERIEITDEGTGRYSLLHLIYHGKHRL